MSYLDHSVAALIFDSKRESILLIKRRDVPVWALPGGAIDPGEEPEEAAIREAHEETGYRVSIIRKCAEYIPTNRLTRYTHVYECEISSGEATITDETLGCQFFALDNLPYYFPPPYPEWITEALESKELIKRKLTSITYWALIGYLFKHPLLVGRFLMARLGLAINNQKDLKR